MAIQVSICDPKTGKAVRLTDHGELIIGKTEHSLPYSGVLSAAGVENIISLKTNHTFIITYLIVASDKTNVETQVDVYETRTVDGDASTAEAVILSGSLAKNDRVIIAGLDLRTLPSRFVNIETDTTAVINVTVMGYYEQE